MLFLYVIAFLGSMIAGYILRVAVSKIEVNRRQEKRMIQEEEEILKPKPRGFITIRKDKK